MGLRHRGDQPHVRCRMAFMKLDTAVLHTMRFGDNSVARIKGRGTVVFMCKNGES
jgi:hypothetical protein